MTCAFHRASRVREESLKNFRSIRRGLMTVVQEIEAGTFGNQYRGSSLEVAVKSIAEQRQIFKGADHAFLWKPKAVTGANGKLGSWSEYLAMRAGILRINEEHRDLLSNDLGAIGGLLFDVGNGRYTAPPRGDDVDARAAWEAELAKVRAESEKQTKAAAARARATRADDRTHTEVQGWLRDLGRSLGFDVWIAVNDRGRACPPGRLGDGCLDERHRAVTRPGVRGP